ncbi:leucine-rich repeat protein [Perkinsela sp. CCAP 1560/4]|nr:leucine-rich repeat protein [Perkinsela sp. CCAP 1560/4]|eukprot:KNH02454.1 leucine-rich repeat protein [Perkinsela sp. CCAP 1560/4]
MNPFIAVVSVDEQALSRINIGDFDQQTLMESLVAELNCVSIFQAEEFMFNDIQKWPGVSTSADGSVEAIDVSRAYDFTDEESIVKELGGSVDFRWIPRTVYNFEMRELEVAGTISTAHLPSSLRIFDVRRNRLIGSFDMNSLPEEIENVSIGHNDLSGNLELRANVPKLKRLLADHNSFTGSLDFTKLPQNIQSLSLCYNKFSGTINIEHIPCSLQYLGIVGNDIRQKQLVVCAHIDNVEFMYDRHKIERAIDGEGNPVGVKEDIFSDALFFG